jgi:hypothetical protein
MINFPNVIDNHVISNEVTPYYVPGSAKIMTNVITQVPDYVSAHNTSDHYPVFSSYDLAGIVTGIPIVDPAVVGLQVFPNPFAGDINIRVLKTIPELKLRLMNLQGQIIKEFSYGRLLNGAIIQPALPVISPGIYFLQAQTKEFKTVVKLYHGL